MPLQIKNPANYNIAEMEPYVHGMYDYFDQKIGFQKPPVMVFDSDPSNQSRVLGKTAYYDPSTLEIHVFTDARHPKDILRSIAHELIHHQQNLEGRLDVGGYMGEGYYLKNEKMQILELEAMKNGNGLMREFEDTLKFEEKNEMSLKEWKNNELNQLLMKKFGILKEEKKNMVKGPDGKMVPDYVVDGKGEKDLAKEMNEEVVEEEQELNEEEVEEGRKSPRTTNADRFVGHEDRYRADRMHEEEELDETSCGKRRYMKESELSEEKEEEMEEGRKSARTTNADKFVGHEDRYQNVREELDAIANLQETIRKIKEAKKVFFKGKRIK